MRVEVRVMPKAGVLDPQGKAIAQALARLGYGGVADVRAGKLFRLEVDAKEPAAAREAAARMAETLLSNPVIEDYEVEVAQ
jgi:phosphoribosylformylglycinamidine synthase subunit PurS